MPTGSNALDTLFGVSTRDRNSFAVGLGLSPFNPGYARLAGARYENTLFSHFNQGATIPPGFTLTEDGTPSAAATYGTGLGGTAVLSSEAAAAKQECLTGTGLNWQANRQPTGQPLYAAFKLQLGSTITTVEVWCGITDAVADTAPIALSSTSTFTTSVPTDGVYMGFSTTPTSGAAFTTGGNQHTAISIATNTDAVVATGGGAFAASTYYIYEFEVDYNGTCRYYVDGQLLGTKVTALDPTKPLTPIATVIPRTTSARVMTVDYMGITGV
jgi:hypothetical protein